MLQVGGRRPRRAKFQRTKGAVKLHWVLDHDGYLPCFGLITDGKVHDVKAAHQMTFSPGTVVVDDRGYNDYGLFAKWTQAGVCFVTRMKRNALYEVVAEHEPPQNRGILKDQTIRLTVAAAKDKCPHLLRRIEAVRADVWRDVGVFDQPPKTWGQHGGGHLQRPLANRVVFQGAQTKPEDQDVCGHLGQCGQDADLNGIDQHAAVALCAAVITLWMELVQLGGAAAHELVHSPRPDALAQ
jgi:hypothetical protein